MPTYVEAIDRMYGVFKAAWDAGTMDLVGYVPVVNYDKSAEENTASLDQAFVRLTVRNATEGLLSIGNCGDNKSLYATQGILLIQIFIPRNDNNGAYNGRQLAMLVRNAYREVGVAGEIWYRNATIREDPPDIRWRQLTVNVEYDFTEIT